MNFTLVTDAGDLDLLGEMSGGGGYDDLLPHAVTKRAFARDRTVLSLPALIKAKRAAGRVKDFDALAELEALAEEEARVAEEGGPA